MLTQKTPDFDKSSKIQTVKSPLPRLFKLTTFLRMTLAAGLVVILPIAANSQAFDFDEWFNVLSAMDVPEVGIRSAFTSDSYCERWVDQCLHTSVFEIYIEDGKKKSAQPLTIGLSWTTAIGLSRPGGFNTGGFPVFPANKKKSDRFVVYILDDNIAHSCNKLIVSVYSIAPSLYKTMPYTRGKGFEYVVYLDNDGGNSDIGTHEERYIKLTEHCN